MKILWMTWKDMKHPQAGGAEFINEEIVKRLAADGHEVTLLVGGFKDCLGEEVRDGYKIIRLGNRFSLYWLAFRYYRKYLTGWSDLVIDEMNTIPFFCKYYVREPHFLLAYQLCRQIWFYQISFPISVIGFFLEPIYLWLLNDSRVITESNSTKIDMQTYGFKAENISVLPIGLAETPLTTLSGIEKFAEPTVLSLGAIRGMKKTLDQILAFELAKNEIPNLKLKVAGGALGHYGKKVLKRMKDSPFSSDIEYLGRVDNSTKLGLMQKCHFILVTSTKEGWGLIVTEANGQGTPALAYNVDGLRDSVRDQITGYLTTTNTPKGLAEKIAAGFKNLDKYEALREQAWKWSQEFTLERCYLRFLEITGLPPKRAPKGDQF